MGGRSIAVPASAIERLLSVRPGEGKRTILLFLYLFLVMTGYVATKSTRDALFLARYTAARLPLIDMASAVLVAVIMAIYLRVGQAGSLRSRSVRTLLIFAGFSFAFWGITRVAEPRWALPALYVWASVFGVLLPAQVWTLANRVLTTREAKRVYGVIGSGAICGWIVGGEITRATATHFGTASLLLLIGLTLCVCPFLVFAIWRERRAIEEPAPGHTPPQDEARGFSSSLRMVAASPYLRAISTVICLSSLVTTIAGWQFRAITKQAIQNTDALAAFFGTFNIYAGILSLAAQLFLTARVLKRWGIAVGLLIVPVALTTGSLSVLVWGGLWGAVLLKGSDQVLRYSIDRSTVELLYLPVPSREIFHAKPFIDTVVWRFGDLLGSLAVLAAISLGASASRVSLVAIVSLAGWGVAAAIAKRGYVENLRRSIYEHRVDRERLSGMVMDRSTSDVLAGALASGDTADILYALGLLADREAPVSLGAVRTLVDHPSPEVRRRAIALLAAARDVDAVSRVEPHIHDDDPAVRAEALLYLTHATTIDPLARVDSDLEQIQAPSIASAMALYLARPGPAQNLVAVRLLLDHAIERTGAEGERARLEVATLIASLPEGFGDQLERLLKDSSAEVAHAARRTATSLGNAAVTPLQAALDDESQPAELRAELASVLERIGTAEAEQALVARLLDPDPVVRLRIVAALNKLRQRYPERRLERELVETVLAAEVLGHYRSYQVLGTMLAAGNLKEAAELQHAITQEVERIFRLMKLLFPADDLHSVYVGLKSENPVIHANAVEFLEVTLHSLPPPTRAVLLPLFDNDVSIAERIKIADRMMGAAVAVEVPAEAEAEALMQDAARQAQDRLGLEPGDA
jgi:AAA family ATP:ADP antiporter